MKKRNQKLPNRRPSSQISQPSISWGHLALTIFCAALIATGFFFAGLQHFQTIDMGIKNAELRGVEEELRSEKRRLLLAREIALSPRELARTAKRLGFEESVEPLPHPNVAATRKLESPQEATVIATKAKDAADARKDENKQASPVLTTATAKTVVTAKVQEARTAVTALNNGASDVAKGETRPRRIVEVRARQSSTASSLSGLK